MKFPFTKEKNEHLQQLPLYFTYLSVCSFQFQNPQDEFEYLTV
jgi:hypothetical protein